MERKSDIIKYRMSNSSRLRKPVLQYDLNNNFIKRWNCLADIVRTLNLDRKIISKSCNAQKPSFSFIWKFESIKHHS